MKYARILLVILAVTFTVAAQGSVSIHLTMGNPSKATPNQANSNNFLMVKPRFVLSYNKSKGEPNWVSWHIDKSELGTATRKQIGNPFKVDTELPASWRIKPTDYHFEETGMQRGHMCPSADRNKSIANARSTFVMTNMIPQILPLNQVIWGHLEAYERSLVNDDEEVYIIAGGVGSLTTIAGGKLNVPKACWKIIVVVEAGTAKISKSTRVIAVMIPNEESKISNKEWFDFRTTVDKIEAETGFDFLSEVATSIQTVIEAKKDDVEID